MHMISGLEYQLGLLADTIQQAVIREVLNPKEVQLLRERLQNVDSLAEAHKLWTHIEEEHGILESQMWNDE